MLFSSLIFLFGFLPVLLLVYYAAPAKAKNGILLLFSFLFYAWGGVSYSIILIFSVLANYLFVRQIARPDSGRKTWLRIGIVFNLLVLGLFKYLDFLIENINLLSNLATDTPVLIGSMGIVLPLGISFFTFQQMSMLWDVYRDKPGEKPRFGQTALYISFFPQLIAGPIVRYHDIIDQIRQRGETRSLFASGVRKFIIGLFKKIVIANTCAAIADSIFVQDIELISQGMAWLAIISYAFQIYFDFSGYSDMAIGLGRMFGFRILENFNFPYIASSIKDFWRRWHISLSTWFRDYLYIPLGGNRRGSGRTYVNLFIVFFLTGLWHGATWSFVFWGLFHGSFLVLERLGFEKILQRLPSPIGWAYTMLVVLIGWVFFRIEAFGDAVDFLGKMFGLGTEGKGLMLHYLDLERVLVLALAVISSSKFFVFGKSLWEKWKPGKLEATGIALADLVFLLMLLYSVMIINSGSYNPFIYFRF